MRIITILTSIMMLCLFVSIVEAKPRKYKKSRQQIAVTQQYDNDGRLVYFSPFQSLVSRSAPGQTYSTKGGRPAGCPTAWCGCWLSIHMFGSNKRELWLARNWLKFPKTGPSVGSVAVIGRGRGGHVGVVVGFDSKRNPILKSGNYRGGVGVGTFSKNTVIAYVSPR